jgi:DNA-binding NarL/FixJ family response regulator
MMADLRLLVVATDPLTRAGLAALLADQDNLFVAGQVEASEGLQADLDIYQPDVVIWDLGWESEDGLALLEEIPTGDDNATTSFVVLVPDEQAAASARLSGALGILFRNAAIDQLIAAINGVANGLVVGEPELLNRIVAPVLGQEQALEEALTPRELEVLQLLAEGFSNKAISRQLNISNHTVKFHVNAIMGKLGAESRTAAVVQATRLGLILL